MFTTHLLISWSMALISHFDGLGWSLRVQNRPGGPYIAGETFDSVLLKITLSNTTNKIRQCPPLDLAIRSAELRALVWHPNGQGVRSLFEPSPSTPADEWITLEPGKSVSIESTLSQFGYGFRNVEMGKHTAQLTFLTPQSKFTSFPWTMVFVEPTTADILSSQTVPLEGYREKWSKEKQEHVVIQQIKLQNKIWLVYRRFLSSTAGGKVSNTFRIAELTGKRDIKVEGAYGDGNPLTITYREHTYSKWDTKHVISSNGYAWTAEEEKHRQERLKKLAPVPEKK